MRVSLVQSCCKMSNSSSQDAVIREPTGTTFGTNVNNKSTLAFVCTDELMVSSLKEAIVTSPQDSWVLIPYDATASFEAWAAPFDELGVKVLGEGRDWKFASKAIMHRHARRPEVPSVIEQIDPDIKVGTLNVPSRQ